MAKLQPIDGYYLRAAEGWLELGNPEEALHELTQISPAAQDEVEVLAMRWSVRAKMNAWRECVAIAERIIAVAPQHVFGWIHRSYALHELKRTAEARDALLPVAERFAAVDTIPYNLACYECQLGSLEVAWEWWQRVLAFPDAEELKARALQDPDLEPLWKRIATESQRRRKAG